MVSGYRTLFHVFFMCAFELYEFRRLGSEPFHGDTCQSLLDHIRSSIEHPVPVESFTAEGFTLLRGMLCMDPDSRVCSTEILTSPWLSHVNLFIYGNK